MYNICYNKIFLRSWLTVNGDNMRHEKQRLVRSDSCPIPLFFLWGTGFSVRLYGCEVANKSFSFDLQDMNSTTRFDLMMSVKQRKNGSWWESVLSTLSQKGMLKFPTKHARFTGLITYCGTKFCMPNGK